MNKSEKRIGERLLEIEDSGGSESSPKKFAAAALKRDRIRIRGLAVLSVLFWLIAVAAIWVLVYGYFDLYLPRVTDILTRPENTETRTDDYLEYLRGTEEGFRYLGRMGLYLSWLVIAAMAAAAISTVALIMATRRVTLRQVEANLAEISNHLKSLKQSTEDS